MVLAPGRVPGVTQVILTIGSGSESCGGGDVPPAPPFVGALYGDTGCAPPVGDASGLVGCEQGAMRALTRFAKRRVGCHVRRAQATFLRRKLSDTIASAAAQCEAKATARFGAKIDRLGCPAAVHDGAMSYANSMASGTDSLDALNGAVYCDDRGDALAIDPGGGLPGFVPGAGNADRKRVYRCERAVWRNLTQLLTRWAECRVVTARALSAGRAVQQACEDAARAEYDTASNQLVAGGSCPPCLDQASQDALRDRLLAQMYRSSGFVYACSAGGPGFSKITDLGLGCLYLPIGSGVPVPDGATKILDVTAVFGSTLTLGGSDGTGPTDCTRGSGPGRHCINGGGAACATDANCGNAAGACALDANCYLVQPIPISNGALSLCLVDVLESDETGTADLDAGTAAVIEHHASRLYLTSDPVSPCPRCENGACTAGKNAGDPCMPLGSKLTTIDCLPKDEQFLAALQPHELFTTAPSELADVGSGFCSGQPKSGAFGVANALRITASGSAVGGWSDLQPHPVMLASVFCIPPSGNALVDTIGGLPAPGVVSAAGTVQLR